MRLQGSRFLGVGHRRLRRCVFGFWLNRRQRSRQSPSVIKCLLDDLQNLTIFVLPKTPLKQLVGEEDDALRVFKSFARLSNETTNTFKDHMSFDLPPGMSIFVLGYRTVVHLDEKVATNMNKLLP